MAEFTIPPTLEVTNDVTVTGSFNPLQDSLYIELHEITPPAKISSSKTLVFKDKPVNCRSNEVEWNIVSEESAYFFPFEPFDEICNFESREISEISTYINVEQLSKSLPVNYDKFIDVSVTFEQVYFWYQVNEY